MTIDRPSPIAHVPGTAWRDGSTESRIRAVPEETAVAFVYDGATEAVMMATPQDLEDFAVGFSFTEGIIESVDDVLTLEIVGQENGLELRMELSETRKDQAIARRRQRAGPVGCGLCGIESLESVMRPLPAVVGKLTIERQDIFAGMQKLSAGQTLNAETRAVHAAGFFDPRDHGLIIREDVGRHNALDKVAGALTRDKRSAKVGIVLLTSRVSVELVQKTAMMGACILAAISAPTALALRVAEQAGITVIGIVRQDGFEVFTHPERVRLR